MLFAFSLLLILVEWQAIATAIAPVPAVIIANLAARERWAWFANLLVGAAAALLFGFRGMAEALASGSLFPGGVLVVAAVLAGVTLARPMRDALARVLPLNASSPVTMLALVGVILIVGEDLHYQAGHDVLAAVSRLPQIQPADVALQSAGLLLIALLGVGWLTRRSTGATFVRLGVVRPAWWQIALALAAAALFVGLAQVVEHLQDVLNPVVANRLNQATSHYYAGVTGVVGVAVIALAPGFAEECLFRGALQPKLGLLLTALAFAAVHSQYALTVDTLLVFTLGAALGLIRRQLNTTSAIITHSAYNGLVGLRLAGDALLPMLGVGILLVGAAGILFWRSRSTPQPGPPP